MAPTRSRDEAGWYARLVRSITVGGRAPLLATQPVPWPPRAGTAIDLDGLTFVNQFDLVRLAVLVGAAPPDVGLTVVPTH